MATKAGAFLLDRADLEEFVGWQNTMLAILDPYQTKFQKQAELKTKAGRTGKKHV